MDTAEYAMFRYGTVEVENGLNSVGEIISVQVQLYVPKRHKKAQCFTVLEHTPSEIVLVFEYT